MFKEFDVSGNEQFCPSNFIKKGFRYNNLPFQLDQTNYMLIGKYKSEMSGMFQE